MNRVTRLLALGLCALASRAQAMPERDCPTAEPPRWRLQADPYQGSGSASLGIYRRVRPTWDLGLQVTGSWTASDDTSRSVQGGGSSSSTQNPASDSHRFSLTAYAGVRKWRPVGTQAAWFIGPQAVVGYSWRSLLDVSRSSYSGSASESRDSSKNDQVTVGLALTAGGDVRLLSHLSLTGALRPLMLTYAWTETRSLHYSTSGGQVVWTQSSGHGHSGSLATGLYPELYLTLTW